MFKKIFGLQNNNKYIEEVMDKTGWNHKYVKSKMTLAKKHLGISFNDYAKYKFYAIPEEEHLIEYERVLKRKERNKKRKESAIRSVMKKTGWDRKYTILQIEAAKKITGMTYRDYDNYDFHKVPIKEQKAKYKKIVIKKEAQEKKKRKEEEKQRKIAQKNERYIDTVVEATGWDREYAKEMMDKSKAAIGQNYEYYAAFRFWELSEDEQKKYITKGDAERLRALYNKDSSVLKQFWNKTIFCKNFEKYIGRTWMSTTGIKYDEFVSKFGTQKKLIYKPKATSFGKGIQVFEYNDNTIKDVFSKLKELPAGIIEGFISQHPEMQKLSINAVNTIRVVTILTKDDLPGVEKNKVNFLYTGLRMGKGSSYVDNMHSGGMIAGINLETGIVETDGSNYKNEVFTNHPDTGTPIKGFKIPYFEELKQIVEEAGAGIPAYLGWDIAISETGPVIVEVNTHPGVGILQSPYIPQKIGKRYVVEKYLFDLPEKPYGTKISSITKEGIEFYWKKPENVNGYEVFRSYSAEGPFESIAMIDKRSVGTYIDSTFDHSKRQVFYAVRSYSKHVDGTPIFGEMTDPKEAVFSDKLTIERNNTIMYSGTTRNIRALHGWGEPEDVCWESTDEAVATIDDNGNITAIATGECEIICKSEQLKQATVAKVVVNREACEPLAEIKLKYIYNENTGFWENPAAESSGDAIIMMVGDMMCGKAQITTQYSEPEGWNFNDSYEFAREITDGSDFAVGNLETLLAAGWPYMSDEVYIDNKNNCNAPSRYLDAIRYGGFDAVMMSNNHNCDGGTKALIETIDQVDKYGFPRTGVFKDADERRYFIVDVNGIKVGFLAYMSKYTGFNGKDKGWTEEEKDILLNVFSYSKAQKDIIDCREAGAEYVIAYMHWGIKNFRKPTEHQIMEAQQIAEAGVDYIIGANPHLIQKYDVIKTKSGKVVPCIYSTGNYQAIMNQVPGNRDSVVMRLRLKKDKNGKVKLVENNYIPCYAYKNCDGCHWAPVAVCKHLNKNATKKNREEIHKRIVETVGAGITELLK